jgi:uncharacterized membrane protein YhaH (DUF805 family)
MGYWLLRPWYRAGDFAGRSPRREFWLFVLQFCVLLFIPAIVWVAGNASTGNGGTRGTAALFVVMAGLFALASLVPGLAVAVRRLHDHDKRGILLLLGLVPVAGWIALLVLTLMPGTQGENIYGPDPRHWEMDESVSEMFE